MLVLSVESSTQRASLGIYSSGKLLADAVSTDQKKHSEFLNQALETCLKKAQIEMKDLDILAADIGPGSFTGVRVAVNLVRSLAYALGRPIFAASSLQILAAQAANQERIAMLNAFRNMIYLEIFSADGVSAGPMALYLDQFEALLQTRTQPLLCLGEGYDAYKSVFSDSVKKLLIRAPGFSNYPRSEELHSLAVGKNYSPTLDWKMLVPLYLRGSAAEENLAGKHNSR